MRKVYLISSPYYHVISTRINEIAGENKNITTFSLSDVTIDDVIEDASYFGLFNDERIIIVKDVKYFNGKFAYEEDMEKLTKFIANIDESTTLILICDQVAESKNNYKKIAEYGVVCNAKDISNEEVNNIILNHCKENNITIDEDALSLLKKNCQNNLDIEILEIDKISNIDNHITLDIVSNYSISNELVDDYLFSNAVVAKNFNVAFDELDRKLESGVESQMLIGSLSSQYSSMFIVRDAVKRGLSDDEIAKKTGMSSGKVYVLKKNSKIYTYEDLKNIIVELSNIDIRIKNGANPKYTLKEFLLNL